MWRPFCEEGMFVSIVLGTLSREGFAFQVNLFFKVTEHEKLRFILYPFLSCAFILRFYGTHGTEPSRPNLLHDLESELRFSTFQLLFFLFAYLNLVDRDALCIFSSREKKLCA